MDSEVVGSNASRQQGRMPRRAALKAGMALAAAGAAVRLGLPPPVARATDTWMLSVPRSDWITSNWHGTGSKFLDIDDEYGTDCTVKFDLGPSTYGKVSFSTPIDDCGQPNNRKRIPFTLWTPQNMQIGSGTAQHITAAGWAAGTRYTTPITVGYISSNASIVAGCWTGSHIHFGCDGIISGNYPDGFHQTWVDYSSTVGDGNYPWYYLV